MTSRESCETRYAANDGRFVPLLPDVAAAYPVLPRYVWPIPSPQRCRRRLLMITYANGVAAVFHLQPAMLYYTRKAILTAFDPQRADLFPTRRLQAVLYHPVLLLFERAPGSVEHSTLTPKASNRYERNAERES
jgi:hypothetical protein